MPAGAGRPPAVRWRTRRRPGSPPRRPRSGGAEGPPRPARAGPRAISNTSSGSAVTSAATSCWASSRPVRSLTPTSMDDVSRCPTRMRPASARKRSWRGARPPVEAPSPLSSTRPAVFSWLIRWLVAVRPRPDMRPTSALVTAAPEPISESTVRSEPHCSFAGPRGISNIAAPPLSCVRGVPRCEATWRGCCAIGHGWTFREDLCMLRTKVSTQRP